MRFLNTHLNGFADPGEVALSLLLPLGLGNLFGFLCGDVFLLDSLIIFGFLHGEVWTPGRQRGTEQKISII